MKTYIPELPLCELKDNPPLLISNVTDSEYSEATMHKTIKINKYIYHYMSDTNELIRRDVMIWQAKLNNRQMPNKTKYEHTRTT